VFSFHAVKIVTTAEGGMITTQDDALAHQLRLLRSHGMSRDVADMEREADGPWYYEQQALGYNYRMTDLQAALGLSQMSRLDQMHARRVAIADRYDALFDDAPVLKPVRLNDRISAWHLYAIEVDDSRTRVTRRELFEAMRAEQIGVNVHYIPIHTQPHYARLGFQRGDFPAAERYYDRAISIPLFPALTDAQQDKVVSVIRRTLAA
jgi:dTDP-4-amino-4,6-dideoxygalactose transaminase